MNSDAIKQSSNTYQNRILSHLQTEKWYKPHLIVCTLLLIILGSLPAIAQPSAGPYGPIQQKYDLPKVSGQIYYAAPDGQALIFKARRHQP